MITRNCQWLFRNGLFEPSWKFPFLFMQWFSHWSDCNWFVAISVLPYQMLKVYYLHWFQCLVSVHCTLCTFFMCIWRCHYHFVLSEHVLCVAYLNLLKVVSYQLTLWFLCTDFIFLLNRRFTNSCYWVTEFV